MTEEEQKEADIRKSKSQEIRQYLEKTTSIK